ncbi:sensor histidine kinase [Pseudoduganella sp. OTU4001]|uniref:sensor histidine kinase n=1 Tax=Pseudoduganella sp. OTU4001 TaxID=3043854 RepID=UPI00313BEAA3
MTRQHYFWLLQLLGWISVALFVAFANRLGAQYFAISAWSGISGLLLTTLWHALYKPRLQRSKHMPLRVALGAALVLGIVQSASNFLMDMPLSGASWRMPSPVWFLMLNSFWIGIMLAWNVCYMAALSLRRNERLEAETLLLEAETLRLEVQAKDAELRALQAQVNPHFFFNSLASVRVLVYQDHDAAARMIDQLATLMRYTLLTSYSGCVPLSEELSAVRAYLAIEKIRFEDRLQFAIEIEPGMEHVTVPPMALQTLVENAVKYGVEHSSAGSTITIRALNVDGNAVIEVANRGAIQASGRSTGVGLQNARKRLVLSKGEQASLDFGEHDGWVRATLRFPFPQPATLGYGRACA